MSNELVASYFKNVLGVDQVLINSDAAPSGRQPEHKLTVVCQIGDSSEMQMLEKMMQAIGLSEGQFLLVENLSTKLTTEQVPILFLVDSPNSADLGFQTYSPKTMIANPSLKSQAWKVLQELKKQI